MPPLDNTSGRVRFSQFYERTSLPLLRYVTRAIGNAEIAEDIVQETYVRSLAAQGLPENDDEARAYIFRVASNLMVDHWRRQKKLRQHEHQPNESASSPDPGRGIDVSALSD